jgi:hypothetical protein
MISSHVEKLSIFHIFNPFSDLLRRVKIDSFPTRGRNIPPNAPHAPPFIPPGGIYAPKTARRGQLVQLVQFLPVPSGSLPAEVAAPKRPKGCVNSVGPLEKNPHRELRSGLRSPPRNDVDLRSPRPAPASGIGDILSPIWLPVTPLRPEEFGSNTNPQ